MQLDYKSLMDDAIVFLIPLEYVLVFLAPTWFDSVRLQLHVF